MKPRQYIIPPFFSFTRPGIKRLSGLRFHGIFHGELVYTHTEKKEAGLS